MPDEKPAEKKYTHPLLKTPPALIEMALWLDLQRRLKRLNAVKSAQKSKK